MAEKSQVEAQEPQNNASPYLSSWRLGVVITSLFFGAFLIALDTNIINVAIPKISSEFHSLEDVAWYGTAYLLTITAFQPSFGTLYKYFKVDTVYRSCVVIFEVGTILCATAVNSKMFIVGRAVAGFGAAGILQGALSIIGHVVELEKRALYMSIVISVFVVSVCIGPVLGGVFTQKSTWRWCFWINLPVGAVVLILLFLFLKVKGAANEDRGLPLKKKIDSMDPLGCLIFVGAICCLLLTLQWGGQSKSWNSSTVVGLLVGFVILACVFGYTQWKRGDKALIPLRILRQRSICTSAGVLFFLGASTYVDSFYIPFYFQAVQGVDPIISGVRFIPLMLPEMVALIVAGAFATRWGYYVPYIILGESVCVVGTALLTQLKPNTGTVIWATYLVITGIGMGIAMQLPYTAVQVALHEDDVPIGNAIAVFSWQLGGAIAIAIGQMISISMIIHRVPEQIPGLSGIAVVGAGATNLSAISTSREALNSLRSIWNTAITRTFILSVATVAAAVPFTLGMEWLNSKKVAIARKEFEDGKDAPASEIAIKPRNENL